MKNITGIIKNNIHRILNALEYPRREGLKDTPLRVAKSYDELFSGYDNEIKISTFSSEGYDQLIILRDIELYSSCEHHMLPFFGKAHIGYIPSEEIIGISKLARVLDLYSRRLQNQERITQQVSDYLEQKLNPLGVGVVLECQHLCMKARGVQKQNSVMITSSMKGVLRNSYQTRQEFLSLIALRSV